MSKILLNKVITWLEEYNPFEDEGLYSSNIQSIWLVGSRAKETHHPKSDYDIAVIYSNSEKLDNNITISSLKLSENLHSKFGSYLPEFKGNLIDIQIFFESDKELINYSKVILFEQKNNNKSVKNKKLKI